MPAKRVLPDRPLTNAEKQARWRARHRDEIRAKRDAERAETCRQMIALNPWLADVADLKSVAAKSAGSTPPEVLAMLRGRKRG